MSTAGDLLRVVICGGLDVGKRTLLGQLQSATAGLSTAPRGYLFADMSGQAQYTYKLVTGASTADLAILLVDACNGMLSLTRWHCQLAALLGVRQVLLAVNKMDRVDYAEEAFRAIEKQAAAFALRVNIRHLTALPLAALTGDNLLNPSRHMPWYPGPTLLEALASASATQSATLTLADEIDLASGDLNAGERGALGVADQFEATIIWMGQEPLLGGRGYSMQIGAATVTAVPSAPKYRIDIDTLEHLAAKTLRTNDIGVCNLSLDRPVPFDSVAKSREAGRFILIDRLTNATVGAGRLHFALRRAHNIHRQPFAIECTARARQKGQQPAVIWLTGLSGAGKSTIANLVEEALFAQGRHTYLLDGDNVRHGLNRDLGFTPADRVENVRRVAEVARLMADAGLIVIVCLISPYRQERRMARELVVAGEIDFIEVFVDTPLAIAEQRDPKGLYRKARRGDLANFTGIDAPYEIPEAPQLHLDAATVPPAASAKVLLACLRQRKIID